MYGSTTIEKLATAYKVGDQLDQKYALNVIYPGYFSTWWQALLLFSYIRVKLFVRFFLLQTDYEQIELFLFKK